MKYIFGNPEDTLGELIDKLRAIRDLAQTEYVPAAFRLSPERDWLRHKLDKITAELTEIIGE